MIRDETELAKRFAARMPIGTRCIYYPVLPADEDECEETVIRSEPWLLGNGAAVVKIEGRSGGVLIRHVFPITTPPSAALQETDSADVTARTIKADARLIAAAPEMFDALKECEEYFDQRADADQPHGCDSPIPKEMRLLMAIRAALSKAETGVEK